MKEYLLIAKGHRATWDAVTEKEWESVMDGFGKWTVRFRKRKS